MYIYSKDGITVVSMIDTRKTNSKGLYPIKIRVNYKRKREYYSIGQTISKDEWENLPNNKTSKAKELKSFIENSFSLVKKNVEALAERGDFSIDTLNCRLGRATGDTLNNAIKAKIEILRSNEQVGSAEFYNNTLIGVEKFAGDNIELNEVTISWLNRCEKYWSKTKNRTTIGMYMRNLRAIMNVARKAGEIKEANYPFGKDRYVIKSGTSTKKALNSEHLKAIFSYSDYYEVTERYRDLWLFIYMCNGINVADLVKLKYNNIDNGFISFVRQKTENTNSTQREIKVAILPQMQKIIDKWGTETNSDNYIFPYLKGTETAQERKNTTKDLTKRINKCMKRIAEAVGVDSITTYTARHSYATISKQMGVSIAYISESMGHSSLKTTESYLASFDNATYQENARLLTNF